MTTHLTRRALLGTLGAGALVVGAAGCDTSPPVGDPGDGSGPQQISWWDHYSPLEKLHQDFFAQAKSELKVTVDHTVHQTAKLGEALTLAKQSKQLPDVHTNVGPELPLRQLVDDGWYQPLQLSEAATKALPEGAAIEGITSFDGKLYTFPLFNFRQYWAATWVNKSVLAGADIDPESPPATYDEFRAACRKIKQSGGEANGWINNLGAPGRLREQVNFMSQAAGFPGMLGVEFATGEIKWHDERIVQVIEFWKSLQTDGLLVEGQFDDKVARTRWASGAAGFYFDGPWCVGAVKRSDASALDNVGVGPMLVPEQGMECTAYRGQQGGAFFISGSSKNPEAASRVLELMLTPEYATGLATHQDQPPIDLAALEAEDVHPAYKKAVTLMGEATFQAPQAVVANPDVAKITAGTQVIKPDIGTIVQGVFSGDVTDVAKALKDHSDKAAKVREQAFAKAGGGLDESIFAFSNWQPRQDYTEEMYQK